MHTVPVPGYDGAYRAVVLNTADPEAANRVQVQVPDVVGADSVWASAEQPDARLPAIGDEVSIRFQDGSVDHPLWSGGSGTGSAASLDGAHRGTVLNNLDPAGYGRLWIQVPGVTDGVWATPEQAPPVVGEEVSVRFEGGSAEHAVWSR